MLLPADVERPSPPIDPLERRAHAHRHPSKRKKHGHDRARRARAPGEHDEAHHIVAAHWAMGAADEVAAHWASGAADATSADGHDEDAPAAPAGDDAPAASAPPPDRLAALCRSLTERAWFERTILVCIGVNCVLLAVDDPTHARPRAWAAALDAGLAAVYAVELALKLGAWRRAFFGAPLNCIDALVACEGAMSAAAHYAGGAGGAGGAPALAVLRMMRLVRPLRTLGRFESLRIVVDALARSARGTSAILAILLMYLSLFALFGVTLWSGLLHGRCMVDADVAAGGSGDGAAGGARAAAVALADDDEFSGRLYRGENGEPVVCRVGFAEAGARGGGDGACALLAAIDAPILCPAGTGCVDLFGQRRADDFEGFDDWPTATLTLFVVTTLDGWSSIMWRVQVRCNPSACVGWNARARQCSTPAHALLTSIRAHSRSA